MYGWMIHKSCSFHLWSVTCYELCSLEWKINHWPLKWCFYCSEMTVWWFHHCECFIGPTRRIYFHSITCISWNRWCHDENTIVPFIVLAIHCWNFWTDSGHQRSRTREHILLSSGAEAIIFLFFYYWLWCMLLNDMDVFLYCNLV